MWMITLFHWTKLLNKLRELFYFFKIAQIPRKKRFGSVFVTLNVKYVLFLIEFSLTKERKKTKDQIKFYQKNNEFKLCKKCRFFPKKPPFIQRWNFEKKLHDICWHQRIFNCSTAERKTFDHNMFIETTLWCVLSVHPSTYYWAHCTV